MSFKYNPKTNEYDVHGTATMGQFVSVWNAKKKAPIHVFSDGVFNYSDIGRKYKLKKVIIDDKGKFHANFLTFDGSVKGPVIVNEGNCEVGCESSINGVKNSGIMIVSNSRVANVENSKYLELKNKTIARHVISLCGSCIKTAGSILIESWADLFAKIWIGNSILLGCDETIIEADNKFTKEPYNKRNHVSLDKMIKNKAANADQEVFTRAAYFVSNTSIQASSPVTNSDLDEIEKLINATKHIKISRVLAGRLSLYGKFKTSAANVVNTMSISGYGLTYPK